MDFAEQWKAGAAEVEAALRRYMERLPREPGVIDRAMAYSLLGGGKRLRAVMLNKACELLGGDREESMPVACGLEMIHAFSLIHDDLPCMDDDDFRRGQPTNHKVYGEAMAVLAGDGLLNLAYEVMLENAMAHFPHAERHLRAMAAVSRAVGMEGMLGGQAADMLWEDREISEEELRFIHSHKTAALLTAPLEAGAWLAGADGRQRECLARYGEKIGLVFQIVDDLLDVTGNAEKLGKKTGMDAERGKATYPSLYGVEESKRMVRRLTDEAVEIAMEMGENFLFFVELAKFLAERDR